MIFQGLCDFLYNRFRESHTSNLYIIHMIFLNVCESSASSTLTLRIGWWMIWMSVSLIHPEWWSKGPLVKSNLNHSLRYGRTFEGEAAGLNSTALRKLPANHQARTQCNLVQLLWSFQPGRMIPASLRFILWTHPICHSIPSDSHSRTLQNDIGKLAALTCELPGGPSSGRKPRGFLETVTKGIEWKWCEWWTPFSPWVWRWYSKMIQFSTKEKRDQEFPMNV